MKTEQDLIPDDSSPAETPIDHNYHPVESDRLRRWEATRSPEYWHYREKWETYPTERIVGDFPIHIDIEATNACNLRCIMCPRTDMVSERRFWKISAFDFDLYRRIIDEGASNGLCSVKYNYLGEPLLNPRIVEMIRYAKNAGVIDTMFNTNACLLDEPLSRKLIAAGLDKLFFSFDSPYREQYNRIRVGADYDRVLGNIRMFMKVRDEMGAVSPLTRVSFVMMKDNQEEWRAFESLFSPLVDFVAYVDYIDHLGQNNPGRMIVPLGKRKKKFCCPQLWQRMFVHPDGIVTACCIDSTRTLQMGNVFEDSVRQIWTGEKYRRIRSLHAEGRSDEIPACAQCPLAKY